MKEKLMAAAIIIGFLVYVGYALSIVGQMDEIIYQVLGVHHVSR